MPCEPIVADETEILLRLGRFDVLLTMAMSTERRRAATGLMPAPSSSLRTSGRSCVRRYR
jgi:hypothetical protein